ADPLQWFRQNPAVPGNPAFPRNPAVPPRQPSSRTRMPATIRFESHEPHAETHRESARTGCPFHDVRTMLREVGLRPTRQRLALGWLLFQKGDRHITAEILHDEASRARVPVSLATVYNTPHQFTEVGLLREFAVDGS